MINPLQIIISITIILAAIPTGLFLAYLTKEEKSIYKNYFKPLLWIIAVVSAVFYTLNIQLALTATFMFIAVFVWSRK